MNRTLFAALLIASGTVAATVTTIAQSLTGTPLVEALRRGGYVLVMRHASSPTQPPDAATANSDNVNRERQLDAAGRAAATAMGDAFRRLRIPVGQVDLSPTYRAMQTARLAGWPTERTLPALGDRGQSMQGVNDDDAGVLRRLAAASVVAGRNRIVITHMPNIARAFPAVGNVADGEALVFTPSADGNATLVGRVPMEEWTRMQ